MLARQVYAALQRGWQTYLGVSSAALFDDLFGKIYDLTEKEVGKIGEFFRRNPPEMHHSFPRDAISSRPSVYIYENSSSQPGFATGDYGGVGGAPSTPSAAGFAPGSFLVPGSPTQAAANAGSAFILSSLWTHQFQILCLARGGPEPVMWATEVNKSILLAAKNFFLSKAMQSPTLACSEVSFRDDLAPSDLFARTITLQCGREFSQADTSQALQEAFKLPGLVGPPGSDTHPPDRPVSHIQALPWGGSKA